MFVFDRWNTTSVSEKEKGKEKKTKQIKQKITETTKQNKRNKRNKQNKQKHVLSEKNDRTLVVGCVICLYLTGGTRQGVEWRRERKEKQSK
jgi:hypothetical protein